jgi:hypothetical protein
MGLMLRMRYKMAMLYDREYYFCKIKCKIVAGDRKTVSSHNVITLLLLIKVIQPLLETIRIVLCLLCRISPLLFKVRTRGRQWFALNQCRNIIGDIVRLVFSGVSTERLASAAVDEELFKVGLRTHKRQRISKLYISVFAIS